MTESNPDRNLLIGILALQMDFIDRDQLVSAMSHWVVEKSKSLDEILLDRGSIDQSTRDLILALLDKHLQVHHGDPQRSLAALSSVGTSLQQELRSLGDRQVDATLNLAGTDRSDNPAGNLASTITCGHVSDEVRFRVLRPHAEGGLGKVSIALDQELHREVALKEIHDAHADRHESRARFLQEAEITGGLEHPGIVPVYGLGQYGDGRPFYAMRFIRGDSLKEAIDRYHRASNARSENSAETMSDRTIEFRKLLDRFVDICNAIEYAHSRGVLHRDLKPGNIMLGKYGETLVVDWGLAKPIGRSETETPAEEVTLRPRSGTDPTPTQMGAAVGTPAFMSPEQAAGRLDQLGPASDVYSLGATLYCLLTGKAPFSGGDPGNILRRVERGEFPRPSEAAENVPAALDAVCLKAMAVLPEDRYYSPRQLADEIERWMADEPVRAYREPVALRVSRWVRRNRTAVAVGSTAALLLAIGITTYGVSRWRRVDLQRQQVERKLDAGIAAARADDFDLATAEIARAEAISRQEPKLSELHSQARAHLQQLEKHQRFLQLSEESLLEGLHRFTGSANTSQASEQIGLSKAEEALATYGILDNTDWDKQLDANVLSDQQIATTRAQAAKLMNQLGIRMGMSQSQVKPENKHIKRAIELFDQAEHLQPPTLGVWMARMLFYRRLGMDAEADAAGEKMTQFARTTELSSDDHYFVGIVALELMNDPSAALDSFRRATAMQPNHLGAHFGVFLAAYELDDTDGVVAALGTCLALRPAIADLYYFRGFAHFSKKDYALAELDFETCVSRNPKHRDGRYWRGRCHVMQEDWISAAREFTEALQLDPNFDIPYSWRTVAWAKTGQHQQAANDATKALEFDSDSESVRWRVARAFALCVAAVEQSSVNSSYDLSRSYGGQSVDHLRKLADDGYFEPDKNLDSLFSSDLDSLRSREDFRQLMKRCAEPIINDPKLARTPTLKLFLFELLIDEGNHADAADLAKEMASFGRRIIPRSKVRAAVELYNAACCYSECFAVALGKESGDAANSENNEANQYSKQAIDLLEEAAELGFRDLQQYESDSDLDPIRGLPEFQKILDGLRADAAPGLPDVEPGLGSLP